MSVRITQDSAKISYVLVSYVVGYLLLLLVGPAVGPVGASILGWVLIVGAVGFAVRTFRGDGEPLEPPRSWWRMTARPPSGYVFAALFAIQTFPLAVAALEGEGDWTRGVSLAINLLIVAMFAQSSLRMGLGRAARFDGAST